MPQPQGLIVRNFALLALIVLGFIAYGSLFPFAFHRMPPGAVHALLAGWDRRPGRGDALANVLLYMPLGYFGLLALGQKIPVALRLLLIALLGLLFSVSIELTQYYDAGRDTEATDVYTNVIGTLLGIAAAQWLGQARWKNLPLPRAADPPALLLLAAWAAYNLFPFVPDIDLHKYWDALKPLLHPSLGAYALFTHVAVWVAAAALIDDIARDRRALPAFAAFAAFLLGAKIFLSGTVLSAAEIAGATGGLLWLAAFHNAPHLKIVSATALLGCSVIALRLEPFQFQPAAGNFGWIPFLSFMYGSIQVDAMSFLEKSFLYGSLIWLLQKTGMRLVLATAGVAAMLFATSLAETHLPGRSAEITDAIVALFCGGLITLTRQPAMHTSSNDVA